MSTYPSPPKSASNTALDQRGNQQTADLVGELRRVGVGPEERVRPHRRDREHDDDHRDASEGAHRGRAYDDPIDVITYYLDRMVAHDRDAFGTCLTDDVRRVGPFLEG